MEKINSALNFKGVIKRLIYSQNNFKVYAVEVDTNEYPFLQLNDYGNVSIVGDLPILSIGTEYPITAIPKISKNGLSYEVVGNMQIDKPKTKEETINFLSEILTNRQCNIILSVYPNIIELIEENRTKEIDFSLLRGIKEASFKKIEKKIKENLIYIELINELGNQIDFNIIKKLFNKYKYKNVIKRKLQSDGYRTLMDLPRIGFKTADSIMIGIYEASLQQEKEGKIPAIRFDYNLIESSKRCEAVIRYILEKNESDGNTKATKISVENECKKLVLECSQHFNDVIKLEDMFYYDEIYISLVKTYNTEKYISEKIIKGLQYDNEWVCEINNFRSVNGFELTEEQFTILDTVCKNNISLLVGYPGTGKSSSAQAVINMCKEYDKSFILVAPTAKAAKVLKEYTKEYASTIHKALGLGIEENDKLLELDVDLVVVDEGSMCDVFLIKSLLSSINFEKTKLLIMGDDGQLPSVGAGNVLYDLIKSNVLPLVRLTKVFRNTGGILKSAMHIREMQKYLTDNGLIQYIGDDNGYCFIPSAQENSLAQVFYGYKTLLENGYTPSDIMVLSTYNKGEYGTIAINKLLQPLANPTGIESGNYILSQDIKFYINDIVMQTVNNYNAIKHKDTIEDFDDESEDISWIDKLDNSNLETVVYDEENTSEETFIANGENGIIKEIIKKENGKYTVIIDFDGTLVDYDSNDMSQVKLGYSISCHKSQGSSSKVVIILTPKAHSFMLNSNLIHVGVTRAKEKVFHIGDVATVNRAIKKKVDFNRDTFLKDLLINMNKDMK